MLNKIKNNWAADMKQNNEAVYGFKWGKRDVIKQLTEALEGEISGSVFEIGCGGGKWTKWLFDMGAEEVKASDVHPEALARTKKYEPRCEVILVDGESIPAADKSFDLVFTWDVLLHLPTYLVQWYLIEAHRVADRLIFGLPSFEYGLGKKSYQNMIDRQAWRDAFFTGYIIHYTKDHIIKMAEYAGWKVKKTKVIRGRDVLCICEK